MLFPLLVTLLGCLLGLFGVLAVEGHNYPLALLLLSTGQICTLLDGSLARWLRVESVFGAKLDYLADVLFLCAVLRLLPSPYFELLSTAAIPFWAWQVAEDRPVQASGRGLVAAYLCAFCAWRILL